MSKDIDPFAGLKYCTTCHSWSKAAYPHTCDHTDRDRAYRRLENFLGNFEIYE